MRFEIPMRIKVLRPPKGVAIAVQRGRDELLLPVGEEGDQAIFEFEMTADLSSGRPIFLGKYSQGPKDSRFVYVNSGTCAGQTDSCWTRRAKISLINITSEQIEMVSRSAGLCIETIYGGTGRDGGPTCASVKSIEWKVTQK